MVFKAVGINLSIGLISTSLHGRFCGLWLRGLFAPKGARLEGAKQPWLHSDWKGSVNLLDGYQYVQADQAMSASEVLDVIPMAHWPWQQRPFLL